MVVNRRLTHNDLGALIQLAINRRSLWGTSLSDAELTELSDSITKTFSSNDLHFWQGAFDGDNLIAAIRTDCLQEERAYVFGFVLSDPAHSSRSMVVSVIPNLTTSILLAMESIDYNRSYVVRQGDRGTLNAFIFKNSRLATHYDVSLVELIPAGHLSNGNGHIARHAPYNKVASIYKGELRCGM